MAKKKTSSSATSSNRKKTKGAASSPPVISASLETAIQSAFNVQVIQLGQPAATMAMSQSMMLSMEFNPVPMPVREEYSAAESQAKPQSTAFAAAAAAAAATIDIEPTVASVPASQSLTTASGIATTKRVTDMTKMPYSAVGRISVTYHPTDAQGNFISGGSPIALQGSGFVVGERTIYSAAHVLETPKIYKGQRYKMTSAVFQPQFPSNLRSWTASQIVIHKSYGAGTTQTNLAFDLAAMITDPNDVAVAPVTGKLGWKTSSVSLPIGSDGVGYPAIPRPNFPFDGQVMWSSKGETRVLQSSGTVQPNFREKDNDMTQGCSGGSWVVADGAANGFRVIGLNSHVFSVNNSPVYSSMISPTFDDDFIEVLRGVKEAEVKLNNGVPPTSPNYKRLL